MIFNTLNTLVPPYPTQFPRPSQVDGSTFLQFFDKVLGCWSKQPPLSQCSSLPGFSIFIIMVQLLSSNCVRCSLSTEEDQDLFLPISIFLKVFQSIGVTVVKLIKSESVPTFFKACSYHSHLALNYFQSLRQPC